jgi:hypothetical protein
VREPALVPRPKTNHVLPLRRAPSDGRGADPQRP